MPLPKSLKKLIPSFSKPKKQDKKSTLPSNPGQSVFRDDSVTGRLPPASTNHVQDAIDDNQPVNSETENPVLNTLTVPEQQPLIGGYRTVVNNDQVIDPSNTNPPPALVVSTTSGVFTGAHHFTIGQLTAITQNIDSGMTVLQQLKEKGRPAAIHDSSARAYPPKCHPDTRKSLRSRIGRWGVGDGSDERMFWVLGPAAVGKSAVAQTIAEEFDEEGRLGASFFFSRPNRLDDPDWVIPTLAYQLATKHPRYKGIITQCLIDDPSILDKNQRTQFKKLIIEPFRTIMMEYPHTVRKPILIILDGLDECKDKQAQCELINLISTHIRQVDEFPIRWLICSRPEWHLQTTLSNADFEVVCERQELDIDDAEAQQDVQRLLEAGFDQIQKKYRDRLPAGWADEDDLHRIAVVASGHLGFASFVLRFIGDDQPSNPAHQLKVCMKFLNGGGTVGVMNPLHALDLLYRQILSDVPADVLPITMRILGFFISHDYRQFSADDDANFLDIDQAIFRRSLQNLHSVIYVPPVEESKTAALRIYHASFSDFLKDPHRSGKFCLNMQAVARDIAIQCLDWMENDDESPSTQALIKFSVENVWRSCCRVSGDFIPGLISRLEHFNFNCLRKGDLDDLELGRFLKWLCALGSTHNQSLISVVRNTPQEQSAISEGIQIEYLTESPRDYVTPFIPDVDALGPPFILNVKLGRAAEVNITLVVIDREAQKVILHIRQGFDAIRQKFKDHVPANWPPESHLWIASAVSRDVEVASFILGFIGDETHSNPCSQLEVCMKFLGGDGTITTINPLYPLDALYRQILSDVSADLLLIAMRVIGFVCAPAYINSSVDGISRFLNLDKVIVYRSLQNLASVLCVPPVDESDTYPIRIHHGSFFSFLKDPNRSGEFYLDMQAVAYDIAIQCLYWIEKYDGSPSTEALFKFSMENVWRSCCRISGNFLPGLISRIELFDFGRLREEEIDGLEFGRFLRWLYTLRGTHSIESLISAIPQEQAPVSEGIPVEYMTDCPRDYIASFFPGFDSPRLPFTLNIRLGKVAQVPIALTVVNKAYQDAWHFLEAGFDKIRKKYKDRLPVGWPPEDVLHQIAVVISGHLDLASFILSFISDGQDGDPVNRVGVCKNILGGHGTAGGTNPLHAVDPLYRQILSEVPVDALPTTMRILGFFIIYCDEYGYDRLSAGNVAKFLNIDQATFYRSLQNLHLVVYIPPAERFYTTPIHVDALFSSFLRDSGRSSEFCLDMEPVDYDVALHSLDWMENDDRSPPNIPVINVSALAGWNACRSLRSSDFVRGLIDRLDHFDFSCVQREDLSDWRFNQRFGDFLKWLHGLGTRSKSIISIVQGDLQEQAIRVEYLADSPHVYIGGFTPISDPILPFTLNFRLGTVVYVYISLVIYGRQ